MRVAFWELSSLSNFLPSLPLECSIPGGQELSVVCHAKNLPADVHSPHQWICYKLEGPFAFSLTGVLLSFIEPLSDNGVPIFAISTYDTDYVLVQEEYAGITQQSLAEAGHELVGGDDESWRQLIE